MAGELIGNLSEPKREVQIWKRKCYKCYKPLGPDEKVNKKSSSSSKKIKCLFCDRDLLQQKSMVSYPVNDNLKFVWQPSCRFEGYVYFEDKRKGKINLKSFIYMKNELVPINENGIVALSAKRRSPDYYDS